jgi:hypothetical protein
VGMGKINRMEKVLFFNCVLDTFLSINNKKYELEISRENDITFSHVVKTLKAFEESKLITLKKEGRIVIPVLTDLGIDTQNHLKEIVNLLEKRGKKNEN